MNPKYQIDEDTEVMHQDCGPWRSYHLETYGNNKPELIANAYIWEIGQDGDSLGDYALEDADSEIEQASLRLIEEKLNGN